jgi:hypothetical protein
MPKKGIPSHVKMAIKTRLATAVTTAKVPIMANLNPSKDALAITTPLGIAGFSALNFSATYSRR